MARDRRYIPGDNYLLDDLSGFKIRAREARIIPGGQTGGLAVSPRRWEPQQPQDFVTGVEDDQTADLVRPRQVDQFILVGTIIVAPSARGATDITVQSVTGFAVGNGIQIMLDQGVNFITAIAAISGTTFTLAQPLPGTVGGNYGDPIENMVLRYNNYIPPVPFVLNTSGQDILNFNVLT